MVKIESLEEIKNAIKNDDMVMLYFGMDSCGVCVDLMPKVEEMLKTFPKVKSYEIDSRKDLKLSAEFDVFTVPVIVIYVQGKETIREARLISVPDLENKIRRYYEMIYS